MNKYDFLNKNENLIWLHIKEVKELDIRSDQIDAIYTNYTMCFFSCQCFS